MEILACVRGEGGGERGEACEIHSRSVGGYNRVEMPWTPLDFYRIPDQTA